MLGDCEVFVVALFASLHSTGSALRCCVEHPALTHYSLETNSLSFMLCVTHFSSACSKTGFKAHKKICSNMAATHQHAGLCDDLSCREKAIVMHEVDQRQEASDIPSDIALDIGNAVTEEYRRKEEVVRLRKAMEDARQWLGEKNAAAAAAKAQVKAMVKASEAEQYGNHAYWEERHAADLGAGRMNDWYTTYPREFIRKAFPPETRGGPVLVVGCGSSLMSEHMQHDGFKDLLSVDISPSAVENMRARAAAAASRVPTGQCRYEVMDATSLDAQSGTFTGAVDKGTLDAMISGGGGKPGRAAAMCAEVLRVLCPGGHFAVISA
ncbi:unnamed protein product, partial [Discosporangium mesarthrocarpum]